MLNLDEMNQMQLDVLKELGNIGAGNATTALSKILDAKVDMKVPKVEMVGFSEITNIIADEETIMTGILLLLEGDVNGMMMFLLDMPSARKLVNAMLLRDVESDDPSDFDDMELSALNEVGNIITGAYLSALSDLTRLTIVSSVPSLRIDMAASLLSIPAIEFGKVADKVLLIDTEFDDLSAIKGYFVLVPDLESYEVMLKSLGL